MPINKNAYLRYKVLDNCFRNTGKRYFIDDLIGTLEVTLELIVNFELEKLLLSFGEDVKVLKPAHLVGKIKERITKAGKQY